MPRRRHDQDTERDPLEQQIELALQPGRSIPRSRESEFVADLDAIARDVAALIDDDPERALRLLEAFLAGCTAKAEEVHGRDLAVLAADLYVLWIKARRAAGADDDETAELLLRFMERDDWGHTFERQEDWVRAMSRAGRDAFERAVRARFDAAGAGSGTGDTPQHVWGYVLRDVFRARGSLARYISFCEDTEPTPPDCLWIATRLGKQGELELALGWVEHGLELCGSRWVEGRHGLEELQRELLRQAGRGDESLQLAWRAFESSPHVFSLEELLEQVPQEERASWIERSLDHAEREAKLGAFLGLCQACGDGVRMLRRLRRAEDRELQTVSHYESEPVAAFLEEEHPDLAARMYRALAFRILVAKKSRYYRAAIEHLGQARDCFAAAGQAALWEETVAAIRADHGRKSSFMAGFEALLGLGRAPVAGGFLEEALRRWRGQ